MSEDDVIVFGGNSPAFRAIVTSLTIFLGALIGVIILSELMLRLYQRIVSTGNRDESKEGK